MAAKVVKVSKKKMSLKERNWSDESHLLCELYEQGREKV